MTDLVAMGFNLWMTDMMPRVKTRGNVTPTRNNRVAMTDTIATGFNPWMTDVIVRVLTCTAMLFAQGLVRFNPWMTDVILRVKTRGTYIQTKQINNFFIKKI